MLGATIAELAPSTSVVHKARAIGRLQKARDAMYPEWHWLAADPNLESLRELPKFEALVAAPPAIAAEPQVANTPF